MKIGLNYAFWKKGKDLYIVQLNFRGLKLRGPLFAILTSYYSDDYGVTMSYTRFSIPKRFITEPS